jgi:septal ring factor EnvC (AmiA/AmiB activator)
MWLGIVTILLVLLFSRSLRKQPPGTDSSLQEEMETFFQEFERENKEMLEVIARFKQNMTAQLHRQTADINSLQEQVTALNKQCEEIRAIMEHGKGQALEAVQNTEVHQQQALPFLREDYKDIPSLYQTGLAIPDIARKLGIGSGEVEMVVQMLRKNEGKE